jgi:hypothetical protein
MKDRKEVIIEGELYRYCKFYNRLQSVCENGGWSDKEGVPSIRRPKCHNDKFYIRIPSRGYASTILHCECGEVLKMD